MTRILMIDNNPDNRTVLSALLARHLPDLQLMEADGGEAGIAMAREHQPELILLDYRMPGMDGPATCRVLKESADTDHIPVIIITAERTGTPYRIRALDAGCDAFLTRPVEEAALAAQVKAMLRLKAAEDVRRRYQQDLERMVAEQTYELNLRNEIARTCLSSSGLARYRQILQRVIQSFSCSAGILIRRTREGWMTVPVLAGHGHPDPDPLVSAEPGGGHCPDILRTCLAGEPILTTDAITLPGMIHPVDRLAAAPIRHQDDIIGVLAVGGRTHDFDAGDLRRLAGISAYLAAILHADREQETARAREELLTAIVEQAAEGVLVTDLDGTIRYVNPALCAMTGYAAAELIGRNPRILKSGKQGLAFYEHLYRELQAGRPFRGVMINRKKDGTEYEEDAVIFPIRDNTDTPVAYAGIKRDLTPIRELEHQLQQSQKLEAVGRLTGGIAHDFNNLLTSILGYSEMALAQLDPGQPAHGHVTQVHRAAGRAAELTGKLLTFSRRQAVQLRLVNLADHLEQIHTLIRPLVSEHISIELETGDEPLPILADTAQLEQVILNLVVNAGDALRTVPEAAQPVIRITLTRTDRPPDGLLATPDPGPVAVVTVSDNGPGIPDDIRDRIFEPFFTTKDPGRGTGLGLATVFGIISQNRAGIRVSETPGGGATFTVYWPLSESEPPAAPPPAVRPAQRGHGETILVVEDESAVREVTASILSGLGYTVRSAENGRDALENLAAHGPVDLVLSDVVMPVMGGPELARNLDRQWPDVPVLFMSGHDDRHLPDDSFFDINQNLIRKPFSIYELAAAISEIFSKESREEN